MCNSPEIQFPFNVHTLKYMLITCWKCFLEQVLEYSNVILHRWRNILSSLAGGRTGARFYDCSSGGERAAVEFKLRGGKRSRSGSTAKFSASHVDLRDQHLWSSKAHCDLVSEETKSRSCSKFIRCSKPLRCYSFVFWDKTITQLSHLQSFVFSLLIIYRTHPDKNNFLGALPKLPLP